jgi:succinate-acetate transporter protein
MSTIVYDVLETRTRILERGLFWTEYVAKILPRLVEIKCPVQDFVQISTLGVFLNSGFLRTFIIFCRTFCLHVFKFVNMTTTVYNCLQQNFLVYRPIMA